MTASARPSRRTPITLLVIAVAVIVMSLITFYRRPAPAAPRPSEANRSLDSERSAAVNGGAAGESTPAAAGETSSTTVGSDSPPSAAASTTPPVAPLPAAEISTWRAVAPLGNLAERGVPAPLGSLDPLKDPLHAVFAKRAAGFARIEFSNFWETAEARRQAAAHWKAIAAGDPSPPPPPAEEMRYVLQASLPMAVASGMIEVPQLGVHSLEIDGAHVSLFGDVWSSEAPGVFVSEIRDGDGTPMLRVRRSITIGGEGYDIGLEQRVENLADRELSVRWIQYGPSDLRLERSRYIDARRFHFGYLLPPGRDPAQEIVLSDPGQMFDHAAVVKAVGRGDYMLWPNPESKAEELGLAWFGATNRYFGFAVHAPSASGKASLLDGVELIKAVVATAPDGTPEVVSELHSPARRIAPGETGVFDLGVFAGPLERHLLNNEEPYERLGLGGLIVYMISGCCSFCTFAWLAKLLLAFLSFLHDYVVFDWGLAIIALVLVVRTILHPITKRAQISLQKTTKAMSELRPEMEKLQQKFKDDPKRLQQETMQLYREKNVNPVGCATGLLPTFLQMPIWIALYAMLYFAFDLRQQPAFFGVFQLFWNWPFLADLSAADHFFWEFETPRQVLFFNLSGINLIPILMGVVFYVQQKYLTPPTAVPLSPEQEQQQKIMKVMMVVLFPVMMYTAPSGLTLYWLTSSLIGIFEVQLIRRHIAKTELEPPKGKPKKKQDFLGRMYEEAMKRAQQKREAQKSPPRKFKER
jgi:YidC/Oxa1 family membrane protein insertase